jgi:hypothetical protein
LVLDEILSSRTRVVLTMDGVSGRGAIGYRLPALGIRYLLPVTCYP